MTPVEESTLEAHCPEGVRAQGEVVAQDHGDPRAEDKTDATFVVFSGDMDRTLAAFTLATTSAAAGMRTTMFFTFWGLTALRAEKRQSPASFIDRMFGWDAAARDAQLADFAHELCGLRAEALSVAHGQEGASEPRRPPRASAGLGGALGRVRSFGRCPRL